MLPIGDLRVSELLERLASPEPGPTGGAAAALACATAAALVQMTASVRLPEAAGARMRALHDRALVLRGDALALGERDVDAYARVLDADGPEEASAALARAADPPLGIAAVAAELAELAAEAARTGSPRLRGDALTGALLAAGAARAAAELVAIDLADLPLDARHERARVAGARASAAGERAASAA